MALRSALSLVSAKERQASARKRNAVGVDSSDMARTIHASRMTRYDNAGKAPACSCGAPRLPVAVAGTGGFDRRRAIRP
jgi:hypothetical protein